MTEKHSLEYCFEQLGLKNGDSFNAAKLAMKQKLHQHHPDRFPNDKMAQQQASAQFQKIKTCFMQIEEYYLIYGEMPLIDPDSVEVQHQREAENARRNAEKDKQHKQEEAILNQAAAFNPDSHYIETEHRIKSTQPNSSAGEIGAGLFVIGVLTYFVLHPPTHKFWIKEKAQKPETTQTTQTNMSLVPEQIPLDAPAPIVDELSEEQAKTQSLMSKTQRRLQEASNGRSFTFGSSYKEVASIHGAPDQSKGDVWFYDKSKVIFKDGKVVDWQSDPSYPLATRLKQ